VVIGQDRCAVDLGSSVRQSLSRGLNARAQEPQMSLFFAPRKHVTILLLACLGTASSAVAQVSLTPTVGIYAPTGDLVDAVINGNALQFKQQVGIALGGRIGVALSSRISLSATGTYVPSSLRATLSASGIASDTAEKTSLYFGTGRVNLWLVPPTSPLSIGLNGGVGVVGRSQTRAVDANGTVYAEGGRRDVGGVVGAVVGLSLGPISAFVSADNYIYKPAVFEALGAAPRTQNDVLVSFGVGVPLGGKRTGSK